MTRRHTWRAAAAAAALVALVAGCAPSLPQPAAEPAPAVPPAATTLEQSDRVLHSLGSVLDAADAALDPAQLAPRVSGPALAMRTGEYTRSKATQGAKPPTALPTTAQNLVVPQTDTWPRTQLVFTVQPDNLQVPRVLVLQQASPRDQYHLWGWARMFPGVDAPATAQPSLGSPVLAPDAKGLVVTPTDALQQYADVLTNGDQSPYAATFAADRFRTQIEQTRAGMQVALNNVGTATETYTPGDNPVVTFATADGGAIVVGELTTVLTETVSAAGGSISITDPYLIALTGTQTATSSFVRTSNGVVIMYVPPANKGGQVQVFAGEDEVTAATAQ
jgi:hypothetical protein